MQVQVDDQSTHPRYTRASLRQVGVSSLTPLLKKLQKANGEVEPLGTGVDTHTHTVPLCGARANDLNRYLKSLRNKRKTKKHRKSSAKRAREKGRSRKK